MQHVKKKLMEIKEIIKKMQHVLKKTRDILTKYINCKKHLNKN